MSRDELIQGYLDGQVSRRAFLRRLIATGVGAAAALTYADILQAMPAGAAAGDFYVFVQDYAFVPKTARPKVGGVVGFGFSEHNTHSHSATDTTGMKLFDTGFVNAAGYATVGFPVAGTYPYRCEETNHSPMTGKARVPVKAAPGSGSVGTEFTITWATSVPAGYVVDVQRKDPGASSFQDWKVGVTTKRARFTPRRTGTFVFRARLRKLANSKHSDWSPNRSIDVT